MTPEQHAKVWRKIVKEANADWKSLPFPRDKGASNYLSTLASYARRIATAYEEAARQEGEKAKS